MDEGGVQVLRTIWFFLWFVISLAFTALFLPLWHFCRWFGLAGRQRRVSHKTSYLWARFLLLVAGTRVEVTGLENVPRQEPVLFVANHQSDFDIPVLLGCINKPKGFLAKIELAKIPVLKSWMDKMDCVFINRSDLRQSLKAINACADVLKAGQSVVIFPEGTRSKSPVMGSFKKGSLRVIEKSSVPVIPVTINGTYRLFEANGYRVKPGKVNIVLSPPIFFEKGKDEKVSAEEVLRSIIAEHLES